MLYIYWPLFPILLILPLFKYYIKYTLHKYQIYLQKHTFIHRHFRLLLLNILGAWTETVFFLSPFHIIWQCYLPILSGNIIWLYYLSILPFPYYLKILSSHNIFLILSGNEYVCLFIAIPSMPLTADIRYIAISAILPLIFLCIFSSPKCIIGKS